LRTDHPVIKINRPPRPAASRSRRR
jgi:hypothetical protein